MAHQTIVEKKLYLRFKGSDRKAKNLIIAHPDEKLKKITANMAMDKIVETNLFEKEGVQLQHFLVLNKLVCREEKNNKLLN